MPVVLCEFTLWHRDVNVILSKWALFSRSIAQIHTHRNYTCGVWWETGLCWHHEGWYESECFTDFVGTIVNIRIFFWFHGEWLGVRNNQIGQEPLHCSCDLFVLQSWVILHEPRKKSHSLLKKIILFSNIGKYFGIVDCSCGRKLTGFIEWPGAYCFYPVCLSVCLSDYYLFVCRQL